MLYDAFIFDLDGTLINTQIVDYALHREILATFGYDLSPQVYASTFGMTRTKMAQALLTHVTSGPTVEQYLHVYIPKLEALFRERTDLLVPGTDTLCQNLYLKGVPMALVTSSPKSALPHIASIARLLPLFSVIITEDDVVHHKPDPEPYQKAVSALHATNPFVFEDSSGVLSANRANLPFALHKHSANTHVARIALTMKHCQFEFEDYTDPRIQALLP